MSANTPPPSIATQTAGQKRPVENPVSKAEHPNKCREINQAAPKDNKKLAAQPLNSPTSSQFLDSILSSNGSSLELVKAYVERNNTSLDKIISILVRKAVQNCSTEKWASMSSHEKHLLVNETFNHALKVFKVSDESNRNDLYSFCVRGYDSERMNQDHEMAKKAIITTARLQGFVLQSDEPFYEYDLDGVSDEHISMKEIEKKFNETPFENSLDTDAALTLIEAPCDQDMNCIAKALDEDEGWMSPPHDIGECDKLCAKYGLKRVGESQIDLDTPNSVIFFGSIDAAGKELITHACRRLENGLWISKRGLEETILYPSPESDAWGDNGYPIVQYVPDSG